LFGDVDCNGSIDSVDALKILRYAAGLPVTPSAGCPSIGSGQTTPAPTTTATPTPSPSGPIAHCWMVVMGFAFVNPGVLGTSADCDPQPGDSPDYHCTIWINIESVMCESSSQNWPTYFCDYFSGINDALCYTYDNSYADYDCGVYDSIKKVDCYDDSYWVDGPDYHCSLAPSSVSCETDSDFFADFVCDRNGSHFTCH